jgi:hypothetical protein
MGLSCLTFRAITLSAPMSGNLDGAGWAHISLWMTGADEPGKNPEPRGLK